MSPHSVTNISSHQACYLAHELTRLGEIGEMDRLSTTLFDSRVDLNPHQVDAALFALANPLRKGVVLADEVGLGKTIEAGLVLCQKWAERKRRLIVVAPAHIRKQWQGELAEKFNLPSTVIDRSVWKQLRKVGNPNPFDGPHISIISYGFAARMKDELRATPFDLVVFDEAHKLRNAYQPSRKGGQAVRWAFELREKLLLTATPLQNSLLELYGLGWLIGDHVFGDRSAFQSRYCTAGGDLKGLRERISTFCQRTLRRNCPYVRFTERKAMTHPFRQSADEKQLHQDVLDFMLREISFAFPMRQRHLVEMVLFKTLASSPQALASTLRTMRQRLVDLRDGLTDEERERFFQNLIDEDDIDIEMLMEQIDDLDGEGDDQPGPIDGRLLAAELAELDSLIARAERIKADSKSAALLTGLEAAFARLADLGAARKAVIFTESRKTQEFLAEYLENNGYRGKVVCFNGSNTHPAARRAYENFTAKHAGSDRSTGSKAIDIRTALIEEFRDRGEIFLATEAAAEGVNLQFASLVVNYDLPWNPQRIEQRIGRCHRYGQKFDVIVLNFLAQDNLADRRVHDLLQQKFSLFEGLFGTSDTVLGTIEDGIDFERRVLDILKTCRTDEQIGLAFDTLQKDLEVDITDKMAKARQQLLEHFDAEVHDRLKVRRGEAEFSLDRVAERFWRLAHWGLDGRATFDNARHALHLPVAPEPAIPSGHYRLISTARTDDASADPSAHLLRISSPLGEWILSTAKATQPPAAEVHFEASTNPKKISVLKEMAGQSGWLQVDLLTMDSDAREEFLLVTAVNDAGQNLERETAERMFDLPTTEGAPVTPSAELAHRLAGDAEQLAQATITRVSANSNARFKEILSGIHQWAEDRLVGAENELDAIKRELRAAIKATDLAENLQQQQEAQDRITQLRHRKARKGREIDALEADIEADRQKLIAQLKAKAAQRTTNRTLFLLRWHIR